MTAPFDPELRGKQRLRVAIIGGGAGAAEFVNRFLHVARAKLLFAEISIYEKDGEPLGRGLAWRDQHQDLLANMRLERLGPSYPKIELISTTLKDMGHKEQDEEYPSRNAMGDALDKRWAETLRRLPEGWTVAPIFEEVTDLLPQDDGVEVATRAGGRAKADLVILALGNVAAMPDPILNEAGRVLSGWDLPSFKAKIKSSDRILIKGASLTAIDVTIQLLANGHEQQKRLIAWHSRSGEIPYVRPRQVDIVPSFLHYEYVANLIQQKREQGEYLTIADIVQLFQDEIAAHEADPDLKYDRHSKHMDLIQLINGLALPQFASMFIDHGLRQADEPSLWFSVAKLLDEYLIPLIWNAMDPIEKRKFLDHHRRKFDRLWAPIPADNARRIKKWLSEGTIQLLRSQSRYGLSECKQKVVFLDSVDGIRGGELQPPAQGREPFAFDYLIEAGGIPTDIDAMDSELVRNMRARKLITPFVLASNNAARPLALGVEMEWYSGRVANGPRPHSWLYTLAGSLSTGALRFTNSYLAVSASAERAATDIVRRL